MTTDGKDPGSLDTYFGKMDGAEIDKDAQSNQSSKCFKAANKTNVEDFHKTALALLTQRKE